MTYLTSDGVMLKIGDRFIHYRTPILPENELAALALVATIAILFLIAIPA